MKNYHLIIPAAAALLLAACAKVSPVENPGAPVTFQVTNTLASTKADFMPGVDGFDVFHTNAILHSTDPAAPQQWFMEDVAVRAKDGSDYLWAPETPYYWPKSSSISFFAYAGTRVPDVAPTPVDFTKIVFGTDEKALVIRGIPELPEATEEAQAADLLPADNILVADPAYQLWDAGSVDVRFRHMLAKVRFQLVMDASGTGDYGTTWTLTVPAQQMLSVPNAGKLEVTYPSIETYSSDISEGVKWTLASGAENVQAINAPAMVVSARGDIVPNPDGDEADNLIEVPVDKDGQPLCVRECVVIPQACGALNFRLAFQIGSDYYGTPGLTENLLVEGPMSLFVKDADPASLVWEPNHIYTYRIIVKANGLITFDPAVEVWEEQASDLNV